MHGNVKDVFIFLYYFVFAHFVYKNCPNTYERYYNSRIAVKEILENETSNSKTKSSITEKNQQSPVEDIECI